MILRVEDGEFIAAAREAVPALCAEVERLRASLRLCWELASGEGSNYHGGVLIEAERALGTDRLRPPRQCEECAGTGHEILR